MYRLTALVTITPVIRRTHPILADVEVLRVVNVLVRTGLDAVYDLYARVHPSIMLAKRARKNRQHSPTILHKRESVHLKRHHRGRHGNGMGTRTHSWLQVYQDRSWDVPRVVALVVKHIFPVPALCRKVFEVPVSSDAVLLAELLPELAAN
jgi:hypothetical protein